jgi:hypothetical protein
LNGITLRRVTTVHSARNPDPDAAFQPIVDAAGRHDRIDFGDPLFVQAQDQVRPGVRVTGDRTVVLRTTLHEVGHAEESVILGQAEAADAAGRPGAAAALAAASASIRFADQDLDISRRLAEVVAIVDLKRIDVPNSNLLRNYIKVNWPAHPEELWADLYQMSITNPDDVRALDTDLFVYYQAPIGPKGAMKARVDAWIRSHTRQP